MVDEIDDDVQGALDSLDDGGSDGNDNATPAPQATKRRGLRRKHRRSVGAGAVVSPTPLAPPAVTQTYAQQVTNRDLAEIWNRILEESISSGRGGADSIYIRCKRWAIGVIKTRSEDLEPIDGRIVAGSEDKSPGEELIEYVTNVYHLGAPIGPARYEFDFFYKSGRENHVKAPRGELNLPDPKNIIRQREAAEMLMRRKMLAGEGGAGVGYYPQGVSRGVGGYPTVYPQPQAPPQAPPPYIPPPVAGASPELEAMRQRLEMQAREQARTAGMYEEKLRQEGLAPAVSTHTLPTKDELTNLIATTVAKTLVGMGFKPPGIEATPPPSVTQVQTAVKDPIDSMETLFTSFERMEKLKGRMKNFFSPEEEAPEEKPQEAIATVVDDDPYKMKEIPLIGVWFGPRAPNESLTDYAIRIAMHNPEKAQKIAGEIASRVEGGAVGQLVRNMVNARVGGGAPAPQQSQHRVVEMPGVPSTPTPPVPPPIPKPNGTTGGWTPTP